MISALPACHSAILGCENRCGCCEVDLAVSWIARSKLELLRSEVIFLEALCQERQASNILLWGQITLQRLELRPTLWLKNSISS